MFLNYFKIALRFFKKNKANTFINILGLAIGLSVSVLIINYIYQQLQYDRFHEHGENIYRLTITGSMADGKELKAAVTSGTISETLLNTVPEVENSCRIYNWGSNEIVLEDKRYNNDNVTFCDSVFFEMFSFPLLQGNINQVINEPFEIVLSRSIAMKYFSSLDVLGKQIEVDGTDYHISGIMEDFPEESHMQADMIASFISLVRPDYNIVERNGISFPTYFQVQADAKESVFFPKILEAADKKAEERFGPYGIKIVHNIQAFYDIYLHSEGLNFRNNKYGDIRNIYIFSFLAFFIIFIAVINYINLMTAQSEKRLKEIGLRKTVGALKWDLIKQFVGESVLITLIAFFISLFINELISTPFAQLLGENMPLFYWTNPKIMLLIVLFVLILGILAGIYPALVLSSLRPAMILKGNRISNHKPNMMRKALVSLQFSISIFLIISLLLMHKQILFAKHKDLGFKVENLLILDKLTPDIRNNRKSLKAELLQHTNIISLTTSQSVPGGDFSLQNCYKQGDDPKTGIMMYECRLQDDYLKTMGIELIEGRDFDPDRKSDTASVILNQTAVRKMGLENPIGQNIVVWQAPLKIIGVVKDYNFASLRSEIDPMALTHYSNWFGMYTLRISSQNIPQTLNFIEKSLKDIDPSYTFSYSFLDKDFEQMYRKEEKINDMITAAALLAIIISMLGLYSLTAFTVRQKIKEIGIRKAIGASTTSIVQMLMRDLSQWIILGNLLAWPLSFWLIHNWLQNFAFRISILNNWWLFFIGAALALFVGGIAMFYQAISAANSNPVDALRHE